MGEESPRTFFELVSGRTGHFLLESGFHSDSWLDLDTLFAMPARVEPLIVRLAELLEPYRADMICGPLIGGAFLAQAIAQHLGVAFIYTVREIPTDADGLYQARYRLPATLAGRVRSRRIAIVDDVISAGSAATATHGEVSDHGGITVVAGALMVLGTRGIDRFAHLCVSVGAVARSEFRVWSPEECPACARGLALVTPG